MERRITNLQSVAQQTHPLRNAAQSKFQLNCETCKQSKLFDTLDDANAFMIKHSRTLNGLHVFSQTTASGFAIERSGVATHSSEQELKVSGDVLKDLPKQVDANEVGGIESRPGGLANTSSESRETVRLTNLEYIQDERREAMRITKVLLEFNSNSKSPYEIASIADDKLSIETNVGYISNRLVKRIEQMGYIFIGVGAARGSPVVWFRKASGIVPSPSCATTSSSASSGVGAVVEH